MTLPPNIKEEIEKEAHWLSIDTVPTYANLKTAFCYIATKFYERGVVDIDAIAKAAFEEGRRLEVYPPTRGYIPKYSESEDYLASDEYKKLVGDI